MKVRMKSDVSGDRNGKPWPSRGGELVLPDEEGAALCANGMAEPVVEDEVETATPPSTEERQEKPKRRPRNKADSED